MAYHHNLPGAAGDIAKEGTGSAKPESTSSTIFADDVLLVRRADVPDMAYVVYGGDIKSPVVVQTIVPPKDIGGAINSHVVGRTTITPDDNGGISDNSPLYERLDEGDIRLLTIRSNDGVTVVCQLHTYPQNSVPEYDAVTYAWGEDVSMIPILCNGEQLQIRTSLFRALPYLHESRPSPQRPLWIDAICLNQADAFEKAAQVPLMGRIYKAASRTLVWLGEAAEDSDLAMRGIHNLTQMIERADPQKVVDANFRRENLGKHGLPAVDHPIWKAVQRLQLRPWFYRLWTFQEISLSRNPWVLCGTRSIEWDRLPALQKAASHTSLDFLVAANQQPDSPWQGSFVSVTRIDTMRERLAAVDGSRNLPVLIILSMYRDYELPVDRIWAVFGLLDDHSQRFLRHENLIDYGANVNENYNETYFRIMKAHVKHSPSVAMQLLAHGLVHAKNPRLPTWCPDWNLGQIATPVSFMRKAAAGVPGGTTVDGPVKLLRPVMSLDGEYSLNVLGLEVDVVQTTSSDTGRLWAGYTDYNGDINRDHLIQSYDWATECLKPAESTMSVYQHLLNQTCEALTALGTFLSRACIWATVYLKIAAGEKGAGTATAEVHVKQPLAEPTRSVDQQLLNQTFGALTALGALLFPPESPVSPELGSLVFWCKGRRFFRTKTGRVGIGPPDMKENDLVCAFFAGKPLFVLRPLLNENQNQRKGGSDSQVGSQSFRVVGDAYMPSFMHGEAFEGTSCESMKNFKLL